MPITPQQPRGPNSQSPVHQLAPNLAMSALPSLCQRNVKHRLLFIDGNCSYRGVLLVLKEITKLLVLSQGQRETPPPPQMGATAVLFGAPASLRDSIRSSSLVSLDPRGKQQDLTK